MPLFTDNITPDISKAVAKELILHGNDTFTAVCARYVDGWNRLWRREDFTTADAQLVFDELGTQAGTVLANSGALGAFIASVDASAVPLETLSVPVEYTVNGDGTVTLNTDDEYPGPAE